MSREWVSEVARVFNCVWFVQVGTLSEPVELGLESSDIPTAIPMVKKHKITLKQANH